MQSGFMEARVVGGTSHAAECMDVETLTNADAVCHTSKPNLGKRRYDDRMDLHLYDSKSASARPFVPLRPGCASIYLCGPTVQGSPHIGHLRAAASFDILVRWLLRYGLDVTYVRNVTDIDDKILMKAAEAGVEWWALAQHYEREFQDAYRTLGMIPPTVEPRATGHITDQIELVERLIERGHAYDDGEGNVYFEVSSQPDYGSLTHQNPADMLLGDEDPDATGKRDPRDFALWKSHKEGEPDTASWPSPWGRGRPAWHLECSAMSRRYLGEEFDIHGGGIDLRFPHHENEQAQSHGAGYGFARNWVHNAWVTTKGEKMSKSVGNTLALDSLLEQAPAPVVRLALSSVHHRSSIEWGSDTLELSAKTWAKFVDFVEKATLIVGPPESIFLAPSELPADFTAAMNDDLNVSAALAVIHEHIRQGRKAIREDDQPQVAKELLMVRSMLDVLGVDPGSDGWWAMTGGEEVSSSASPPVQLLLDTVIGEKLKARDVARANKDWEQADQIRDWLSAYGITVADGPDGPTWTIGA